MWSEVDRWFTDVAKATSYHAGRAYTFIGSLTVVLLWALSGPYYGFSNGWQLVINTGTTILTFEMVFLLQNTMNRDTLALQLKLDELIRANVGAHDRMISIDTLSEEQLHDLKQRFDQFADRAAR